MCKDKRNKPRWLQKIYANLNGYFWLPCPLCKQFFGGHESHWDLYLGFDRGSAVCKNCVDEARRLSNINRKLELETTYKAKREYNNG